MSYGVGWFGRVFGTLGMFGSVVFFVMEVCSVRECFWCGTDHLPEIGPAGLPFFGLTPPTRRNQKREQQTTSEPKKECLFFV